MPHTPEPWELHAEPVGVAGVGRFDHTYWISGGEKQAVCIVIGNTNDPVTKENAELLLLAPRLARVLERMTREARGWNRELPTNFCASLPEAEDLLANLKKAGVL